MFVDTVTVALMPFTDSPVAVFVAIMLATFILEDAATIAVGLLASQGAVDPTLALIALVVGTASGDLAIHGIGRIAERLPLGRRLLAKARMQRVEAWLRGNAVPALAGARFVPGLRLPVYLMSGFVRVPFATCAGVVIGVSAVWTPALFIIGQKTGAASIAQLGVYGWAIGAVLLAIALAGPHLARAVASRIGRLPALRSLEPAPVV
jgi:membrane protein DedA with SNARE-associated domain